MFRIGEFSRLTQVSVRMLRYYEAEGLLRPAAVDPASRYRLYTAGQIAVLERIRLLRDLGFSVAEMREALVDWDEAGFEAHLERRAGQLEADIAAKRDTLARLRHAREGHRRRRLALHAGVNVKDVPAVEVLSLRRVVADYYAEGQLWKELAAFAEERGVAVSQETFTIYHGTEAQERDVDMEICAPVARLGESEGPFAFRRVEGAQMAYSYVQGPFEEIAGAFYAFAAFLEEHPHWRMGGHSRQIVHRGPWNEEEPANYLTEMQIPLVSEPGAAKEA